MKNASLTKFSPLGFSVDFVERAYRSELSRSESGQGGQEDIIKDFTDFFLILDAAIRFEVLYLAGDKLDATTKEVYKDHVEYMCDQSITAWNVFNRERGTKLLEANQHVKQIVDRYKEYCKKPNDKECEKSKQSQ